MPPKHKQTSVLSDLISITPDETSVIDSSSSAKVKTPTSRVWSFFDKVKQDRVTYLQRKVKYKLVDYSTINMKTHMRWAHHSLWKTEVGSQEGLMDRFLKWEHLPKEFNIPKFHELLAEWIVLDDEPFIITESKPFW